MFYTKCIIPKIRHYEKEVKIILDFITEKESAWEKICNSNLPKYVYGIGDVAVKIILTLKKAGVKVDGIFSSSDFPRTAPFMNYKVENIEDIRQRHENFIIILAFGTEKIEVIQNLYDLNSKYTLLVPDIPVIGTGNFDWQYAQNYQKELETVYDLLEDDQSKQCFSDVCNFKISGNIKYLKNSANKDEIYKILNLTTCEHFVDLGAYTGDTVKDFLEYKIEPYASITAFEPAPKNFLKLRENTKELENVTLYEVATWCKNKQMSFVKKDGRAARFSDKSIRKDKPFNVEARKLDSFDLTPTFINIDVEGAERQTLQGAKKTIIRHKPKILLPLYHRMEDFFDLPLLLKRINKEYKFYIRRLPYIPAWDFFLISV
jgi:FkbM family methyltransferase